MGDLKIVKISVIIAVYNESSNYFHLAIDSILNQSYSNFELILILDNPKNIILEKEILKYLKKDKRIIFIKNKKNFGLAYSLNLGIKIAKGKYIARMDGDDISQKDRLKLQLNYLEFNNKIDLLFSKVQYIDEKNIFVKNFDSSKFKISNLKKYFFKEHLLVHPTLFCKSSILKENLFNIKQLRSQDFELWVRLISKNYKFDLIENYLLKYRIFNQDNYENRFEKVKTFNYWVLYALNLNLKNIFKINFFRFIYLYIKTLICYSFLLIFPKKFIKNLVLIKDRLKK